MTLFRKSSKVETVKTVDPETFALALAKAVNDGDIVNFRFLFGPASPARLDNTQTFDMRKYAYLLPDSEEIATPSFKECLIRVKSLEIWGHIQRELAANRPPQLPSDLVLVLADNAVRRDKYSSAAQAYELLRIRARMQREVFAQADAALNEGNIVRGVRGYLIAVGLGYDYAAFPEPLPATPDYQTRALILHADYPEKAEVCLGMQESESMMETALAYLLLDAEAAARLRERSMDLRVAFVRELVRVRDPKWSSFADRFREGCRVLQEVGAQIGGRVQASGLVHEIREQQFGDLRRIPALLLGRSLDPGEWWQYLKELAYEHPAAVLFVARQEAGGTEILIPLHRTDSPLAHALGAV